MNVLKPLRRQHQMRSIVTRQKGDEELLKFLEVEQVRYFGARCDVHKVVIRYQVGYRSLVEV